MNIQEALTKVKELKADALGYIREASKKQSRTIYLDVPKEHYKKDVETDVENLIDTAIDLLTEAHEIKLAIQKANAEWGLVDLIQEADLLKSLCVNFKQFEGMEQETDPEMSTFLMRSTTTYNFEVRRANFDTVRMNKNYSAWQERIREINKILQKKNWEVEIKEVGTSEIREYV